MEKLKEWNENVGIDWWKEGRTKLNKVIRKYNKWIDKHSGNKVKTLKLLEKINEDLEKHYCNQSGGSGWKEELLEMKSVIEGNL
jgi:hypothetical protein